MEALNERSATTGGARADGAAGPADTAARILELLFRFRRAAAGDSCLTGPCRTCYEVHCPKIQTCVAGQEPMRFVILAFPAKSPNRRKTLGPLPDLAERLALTFLQRLCDQIGHYHRPGARITICTDGHVFSDLVGVPDAEVSAYRQQIVDILEETDSNSLELYSLADAYGERPFGDARRMLLEDWAPTLEDLRSRTESNAAARDLFNGIHRFMFEDQMALRRGESRNKVRTRCKELAYRVIQRSNAWSNLVEAAFPEAPRLSIHPQPSHSHKLGLHMVHTRDAWLTPWHGVALDNGTSITLVKRKDAERLGATVVLRHGRPSHFVAPHVSLEVAS